MRVFVHVVLVLIGLCLAVPAQATDYPDYLSLGGGIYNFDKKRDDRVSRDYRLEYRFGYSLLPHISDVFDSFDRYVQIHPVIGFEANGKGAFYANAGMTLDVPFLHYGIFTWGESLGAFGVGDDVRTLGSILQFRSQVEVGLRFDNDIRLTGFISHLSNAHLVNDNPGAEIVGAYLHIPLTIFGAP